MTTTLPHTSHETEPHLNISGAPDKTLVGDAQTGEFNDVVGFRSEGKSLHTEMDDVPEDHALLSSLRPSLEQDHTIESILSRPIKIATINWTTGTSTSGAIMGSYDVIDTLLSDNFNLARQKLSGFYGMHATAHLKVLVNPEPMQQGLFQIFYIPFARTFTKFPYEYDGTEMSLAFTTGCPNVMCNIATQSSVELAVPYTGSNAFVVLPSISKNERDWGKFFVQSLVPLADATNDARAEISVYMYFTGVSLFGATPQTWVAQGDFRTREEATKRNGGGSSRSVLGNGAQGLISAASPILLDMLGLSKPVVNQNPSRMLLSPFANVTLADSTSAALKLSMMEHQNVKMGQLGVDRVDEMDIQHIISKPCYFNQVEWKTSTTHTPGTLLMTLPVEPNATITATSGSGADAQTLVGVSRLRYVANIFGVWRGDIEYTFLIPATKFTSGRLRFVYSLNGQMPTDGLGKNFPYAFSTIVDLRDGLAFKIVCPYFASTPWRATPRVWNSTTKLFEPTHTDAFEDVRNVLQVYVENGLRTTTGAHASVQIVSMISGGKDFEFGMPTWPCALSTQVITKPVSDSVSRSRLVSSRNYNLKVHKYRYEKGIKDAEEAKEQQLATSQKPKAKPRSGRSLAEEMSIMEPQGADDMPIINMVEMTGRENSIQTLPTEVTLGEKIRNLRPLLRRYFPIGSETMQRGQTKTFELWPFVIVENARGPGQQNSEWYDYHYYISQLYVFARGGMRYLIRAPGVDGLRATIKFDRDFESDDGTDGTFQFGTRSPVFLIPQPTGAGADFVQQYPTAVTQPYQLELQGGAEFEIPYYSKCHKVPFRTLPKNRDAIKDAKQKQLLPEGRVMMQIDMAGTGNYTAVNNVRMDLYRGMADDFDFGFLLGAPPVVTNPNFTIK